MYCTIAFGPGQSSQSWVEVPQNSRPYFTVSFETSPTWRARSPYLYPPGTRWPSYTPRNWVPFLSPLTTRKATLTVSWPPSTRENGVELEFLRPTVSRPVHLGIGPPFVTLDQILAFFFLSSSDNYFVLLSKEPSLTRKRVCGLQCNHSLVRLLTPNNHTLPSHLRLCSLFGASYDSQGQRWKYSNPPPHLVERSEWVSELIYDRQSVGQYVLVSGAHLGPVTNFSFTLKFLLDIYGFVSL
jgi:hypothetical protein